MPRRRSWFRRNRDDRTVDGDQGHVVIGQEMASALDAERSLRERQPGVPSPIASSYDPMSGDFDLLRFSASHVDDEVTSLIESLESATPDEIEGVRLGLTVDGFYVLLNFARRQALVALRADDPAPANNALVAVALVDIERVDWRDVPVALGLPLYVLARLGINVPSAAARARQVAQPKVGNLIEDLARRDWSAEELAQWGYIEIAGPEGPAFVDRGIDPWEPTVDLLRVALGIASVIDADEYRTTSISVAQSLPEVWFPKAHREDAKQIASTAPGVVNLSARARPSLGGDPDSLQFTCFVAEVEPDDVERLVDWASHNPDAFHSSLAVGHGRVFVMFVARSFVAGVADVETSDSLQRFRAPVLDVVRG